MKEYLKILIPTPEQIEEGRKRRLAWWNKTDDPTCLSYWFPKIKAAGLSVPKTILVPMSMEENNDIWHLFDGEPMAGVAEPFFEKIRAAADEIGYPCFLRTGQTSAKHNWSRACYLPSRDQVEAHVIAIVEFSSIAGIIGLRCNIWAVRELLPVMHYGTCPRYGDMPICKEFRFFVKNDEIICWHPYWPMGALEQGGVKLSDIDYVGLCRMDDEGVLSEIASAAGGAVGGSWSVDILETSRGWYLTDMAEAHKSFHWEGCNQLAKLYPEKERE
jgi:hypothetical protein